MSHKSIPAIGSLTSSGRAALGTRKDAQAWRPWAIAGSVLVSSLLLLTSAGSAIAASSISIELNRLQEIDNGCRMNLVFTNRMSQPVDLITVETVLFDKEERVDRFLLLRARDLPPGKIRVHQFDVSDTNCSQIGKVLLNDVTECEGQGLDPATCLAEVALESRAGVPFVSTAQPDAAAASAQPAASSE